METRCVVFEIRAESITYYLVQLWFLRVIIPLLLRFIQLLSFLTSTYVAVDGHPTHTIDIDPLSFEALHPFLIFHLAHTVIAIMTVAPVDVASFHILCNNQKWITDCCLSFGVLHQWISHATRATVLSIRKLFFSVALQALTNLGPAEQPPLAVFPHCTRRYWVDMWSAHRIPQLNFQLSKPDRYFFIQVTTQFIRSRGWVDPVPDPTPLENS
jgi:hypothetical protein